MCYMASFGTGASILDLWLPFNYRPSYAGIVVFASVYGFVSGSLRLVIDALCREDWKLRDIRCAIW